MTRRVLIVEDDVVLALDLELELAGRGYRVVGSTGNLAVAVRLARTALIDAAVLDVDLGHCTSFPVADVLRGRSIPFVFVTGHDRATIDRPYDGVAVLRKPVAYAELFSVLARLT